MAKTRRQTYPVLPVANSWWELLDHVAARLGVGALSEEQLVAAVYAQSEAYTRQRARELAATPDKSALAARLRFFLTRDMGKVAGPLDELARLGRLPAGPVWRVLDLGAGMGATALGVAEYAARRGIERVEVVSVEQHASLAKAGALLAEGLHTCGDHFAPLRWTSRAEDLSARNLGADGPFDLIVAGFVLNELWPNADAEERADRQSELLERWCSWLTADGAFVALEPALRETSRAVSVLRDRLVQRGAAHVLAPCVRTGPCPMLEVKRDWCHAERAVALPEPLAGLARAAGLRFERLTFSYLALASAPLERRFHSPSQDGSGEVYRVVSSPLPSKGKLEWFGCGEEGRVRLTRLDREKSASNRGFCRARRGDLVSIQGLVRRKSGGLIPPEANVAPIENPDGTGLHRGD